MSDNESIGRTASRTPGGVALAAAATIVALAATLVAVGWMRFVSTEAYPVFGVVSTVVLFQLGAVAWTVTRLDADTDAGHETPVSALIAPVPFTLATVVTLLRGGLVAGLAGFAVVAYPTGSTAWIPALVFGVAALLDAVDGALARATDTVSRLGERLDTSVDSLAVLVGAAVLVSAGFAPLAYLGVGAARYAFVGGIYYRKRRGRPVRELPPSTLRRTVGALQLFAIFLSLSPALGPTASWWVTALAMWPLYASFGRDWLVVSGRRTDDRSPRGERPSVSESNE